jgi:hypothetical protein
MPRKLSKAQAKAASATGGGVIPKRQWSGFLNLFSLDHYGWPVRLETHDRVTDERVVSGETPLESIDYDLEDEINPRINVVVRLDNKIVKHILFLPSKMSFEPADDGGEEVLHVTTVNTETAIHLQAPELP